MNLQVYRLWPRRPPDGMLPLGLSCDDEGLLLAGNCRLIYAALNRHGALHYIARSLDEIRALLTVGYGRLIDVSELYPAIERLAEHMSRREWTQATLAALHLRLPDLLDQAAAQRVLEADQLLKVWDPLPHPRWPQHSEEGHGGQFRPGGGDGSLLTPVQGLPGLFGRMIARLLPRLFRRPPKAPELPTKPITPSTPRPKVPTTPKPAPPKDEPPGIGHNQPPEPIEPDPAKPPRSPQLPPTASGRDIYRWGRVVADAIAEAARRGSEDAMRTITDAVDAARKWLQVQYDNIVAYLDPPKSYEELMSDAQEKGGGSGYEVHHIVEQWKEGIEFSKDEIEDPSNKVRISYHTHKMIQSFYQRRNPDLGGMTPRQYLEGKSFDEQLEFGKDVLRKFGAMK